jgi:hypothetical protein
LAYCVLRCVGGPSEPSLFIGSTGPLVFNGSYKHGLTLQSASATAGKRCLFAVKRLGTDSVSIVTEVMAHAHRTEQER